MKLFNNHSGSRGLPSFIKGMCWATSSFLRNPFTEGCVGVNEKAPPPGLNNVAVFISPTRFSSVQLVFIGHCFLSSIITS